jgi:hypothetical protein
MLLYGTVFLALKCMKILSGSAQHRNLTAVPPWHTILLTAASWLCRIMAERMPIK